MTNWTLIREQLWDRSGGRCEVTGRPADRAHVHHRRLKGMGGTSRPDVHALFNLLLVLPEVHNGGGLFTVHGNTTWSRPRGYLLSTSVQSPQLCPVLLFGQRWVLLGSDGDYHPLPAGILPPEL